MAEIDPLSQQLGELQGAVKALTSAIEALDRDIDRRFREVWARIGTIERSTNGWKQKGIYAGGGATVLGLLEMIRHWWEKSP